MEKAPDKDDSIGSPYRSFYKVVAVSACAHVLFIAVILYGNVLSSRTINYNPVYTVRLVSALPSPAETKTPALAERTAPGAPSVMPVSKPVERMVLPIKKAAPYKNEMMSAIRHVESELKRQQLVHAIHGVIRGELRGTARSGAHPVSKGSAGQRATEGATGAPAGPAAQEYYALIWQKIKSEWVIPPNMADTSYGDETVVDIALNRDGTISSISIEKSSGNVYFDQTAIRAIKKASPLPPFPPSWLQRSMDMGIKFSCKEGCK